MYSPGYHHNVFVAINSYGQLMPLEPIPLYLKHDWSYDSRLFIEKLKLRMKRSNIFLILEVLKQVGIFLKLAYRFCELELISEIDSSKNLSKRIFFLSSYHDHGSY